MAIRITTTTDGTSWTIRLEGRLDKSNISELLVECRSTGSPLKLDLAGLMSVDADGVEALRALTADGAELLGISPYIRQLLLRDIS